MIRVRTDDVLVTSEPMQGREFQKWRKHHLWLMEAPDLFYHTPAILCRDIQGFPEAIDYIKNEQAEGRLRCDLHGWEHDPEGEHGKGYSFLSVKEIEDRLEKCMEWFEETLSDVPIRWLTPHGSNSPEMQEAANKFGLTIETTELPVIDQKIAEPVVKRAGNVKPLEDKVIMVHWFERGLRLFRIVQVAKYGSWKEAAKVHPEYFK